MNVASLHLYLSKPSVSSSIAVHLIAIRQFLTEVEAPHLGWVDPFNSPHDSVEYIQYVSHHRRENLVIFFIAYLYKTDR